MSWQKRIVEEKQQLYKKIEKLQEFMKKQQINLSDKQWQLLDTQLHIMVAYHNILIIRLEVQND